MRRPQLRGPEPRFYILYLLKMFWDYGADLEVSLGGPGGWYAILGFGPMAERGEPVRYWELGLNWHWPRWEFGRRSDWYDGPHESFIVGPLNLYWNW